MKNKESEAFMKTARIPLFIIILSILFIISASYSQAVGISVTKAILDYRNVLRGGYAEDVIYVSTDADFDIPISYELIGDLQNWTVVSPDINSPNSTVTIRSGNYQALRIAVQPPEDIPIGTYTGTIRILTGTLNNPEGQYGSQLQAAFMIRMNLEVTGTQFMSCSGAGIILRDTEVGNPLEYSMNVFNSGNVRIKPTATIDIWNQDQTKLIMTKEITFASKEIFPTTNEVLFNSFDNNLRIGQYWAYVTVLPCGNSALATFNVYEKGTMVDTGELIRLDSKSWAKVDEVVPISAVFQNTGERTVSAKFKGVVTSENRIVETIDSEFYDIPAGETGTITVYFTPKRYGQYIISGRVLYNNKLTFEKSTVINVNEGVERSQFNWTYVLILIVLILIILLLLIRIKRKRQNIHRL